MKPVKTIYTNKMIKIFFFIVFLGVMQTSLGAVLATPLSGDNFQYNLSRDVNNGTGAYYGYTDQLKSTGTYLVNTISQNEVQFHVLYAWTYTSSEGANQANTINRNIAFSLETRKYTSSQTDLDEYDAQNSTTLYVWFWVDLKQGITTGSKVHVLDQTFTVTSMDSTIWTNGLPKKAIALQYSGNGQRNDVYGNFQYTYTETYYYAQNSGYIIAERYDEHDTGTWQGQVATFELTQSLDVVNSSYTIPIDYFLILLYIGSLILLIVGSISIFAFAVNKYRWRRKYPLSETYGTAEVFRLKSSTGVRGLQYQLTDNFGYFIEDFINRALITKDRVAVAVSNSQLLGLAINNNESKIGLILSKDTDIKETLRRYIGVKDFFSEVRAKIPNRLIKEAELYGEKLSGTVAYNIFDTYQVLRLDTLQDTGYDTTLIVRMQANDLGAVTKIAEDVYGVQSKKWLYAQFLSGDIGYVAKINEQIVGFAFASYVNGHGRLHTLTVLPEYRNRGIGKELMRARLKALYDLETQDVITEIADWNLASLRVAFIHGFKQIGNMYVETVRTERIKKSIVRR